jgi:Tannase and feruloyl esterase
MVPGMQHCSGGLGPNDFGQFSNGSGDPPSDISRSLERWVEQGTPPAQIVAAKSEGGKTRTRQLCPYPHVARWDGSGNTDNASSFTCVAR